MLWRRRRLRGILPTLISANPPGLLLDLGQIVGIVGQICEDHSLFVIVFAEDLIVAQEEAVSNAKSTSRWLGLRY